MKIAIVTNNFPAASETFISNKILFLVADGHEVIVFCSSFNKNLWLSLNAGGYRVALEVIDQKAIIRHVATHPACWLALIASKKKSSPKISLQYFTSRVNKRRPDIIHFEFSGIGIQYMDTFKNIAAKKIVSCRGSAEKVKLLAEADRKEKTRILFNLVDGIHCVSNDMRTTILPYCNQPGKIFVNYPSINAEVFCRKNQYQHHQPISILSIGRFTFQKGYLTGLLAARVLKESGVDFTWTIVGDGQQKEEIIFHIHQLGLQQLVTLVGTKTSGQVKELYNECDIFFLPSVYEGIANVALEAMSMQLPVVATRSGGMDEVITHGINGMLANVYDSTKLADYLLQLATNQPMCIALGKNARKRVLEQFTIEKQVKKFEEVYSSNTM